MNKEKCSHAKLKLFLAAVLVILLLIIAFGNSDWSDFNSTIEQPRVVEVQPKAQPEVKPKVISNVTKVKGHEDITNIYEYTPKAAPHMVCVVMFASTWRSGGYGGLECFPKQSK